MDEAGWAGLGAGDVSRAGGCPGRRMRQGDRDTLPGGRCYPQTLFLLGGGRCSPLLSHQELCREGAQGCGCAGEGLSPPSPFTARPLPPQLFMSLQAFPSWLTHGFQPEGKATWGSSLAQGERRTRTGHRLPSRRDTLLLARTDFWAAAELQVIPK